MTNRDSQKYVGWMRKNLTLLHANSKGSDQPAHLHSLISAFVIGFLQSLIS